MVKGQYVKYLVCYDIPSDKKRKKFADALKDLGLTLIQKSVFYGDLKPAESRALARTALQILDSKQDKCFWFPCRLNELVMRSCIGYEDFSDMDPDGHGFI